MPLQRPRNPTTRPHGLLRNPLLKRVLRRLGIPGDALEHLRATLDLNRPSSSTVPRELVPMGARMLARALLTQVAVHTHRDWVWPFWIERQYDPTDPAFTGRGHTLGVTNVTHRNWTGVGLPGRQHPREAAVDPRGLVTPWKDGWSWDVWLHTGNRLYAPSRLREVDQRLSADGTSVLTRWAAEGAIVETEVFLSPRDTVEAEIRVTAARGALQGFLVLALRPANPEGVCPVRRVAWNETRDGLTIDGAAGLTLDPPADLTDTADVDDGDVAFALPGGRDRRATTCRAGLATAAAIWHLDLPPDGRRTVHVASATRPLPTLPRPRFAEARPDAARRLREATGHAPDLRAPDPALEAAWRANVRNLAILWDGDAITPGTSTYHHFWFRDTAYLATALFRIGMLREATEVLLAFPRKQRRDGFFLSQDGEWDSNGQAIWTIREGYRYTRDPALLPRLWPSVRRGADWIVRKRSADPDAAGTAHAGLLPPGFSAEHLGPNDWFYWDDLWGIAGLEAAADLARLVGRLGEANRFDREARAFRADLEASLAAVALRLGRARMPASPYRRVDAGAIGSLAAVYPLQLFPPTDPRIAGTVAELEARCLVDGGFFQEIIHGGTNPYLTAHIGQFHLARRDARAWDAVAWHLRTATPTWTWPEAVNPRTGGGVMGDGHDGWSAADFLHLVRCLFLLEEDDRLVVFPAGWPDLGNGIASLDDAPTHFGRVSVRWAGRAIALTGRWTVPPREIEIGPTGEIIPVKGPVTEVIRTIEGRP